jgi:hypothetical protein
VINQSIDRIVLTLAFLGLSIPAAQAQVVRSYLGVGHYPPRQHQTYPQPPINRSRTVRRSVLVDPTLVNPTITDSILINPTMIGDRPTHHYRRYDRSHYRTRIHRGSSSDRILIQISR